MEILKENSIESVNELSDTSYAEEATLVEMKEFEEIESSEVLTIFDKESEGLWSETEKKISKCEVPDNLKNIPLKKVWHNFSPFFNFKWDSKFKAFAALLLAVWEKESSFRIPDLVLVNTNCKGKGPFHFLSLKGSSIPSDLANSQKKDKKLKKLASKCDTNMADFGVFQWNYHWRLSRSDYRSYLTKAILLSSKYPKKSVDKQSQKKVASLIKYNSKALFILGGLYLVDNFQDPKRTIANYNVKKSYHKSVNERRNFYWKSLNELDNCVSNGKILGFK